MWKYRKKPIEIEAFEHRSNLGEETNAFPKWLLDAIVAGTIYPKGQETYVKTLEGNMLVNEGDMIIRGIKGEIYPCKRDIFDLSYDKVD